MLHPRSSFHALVLRACLLALVSVLGASWPRSAQANSAPTTWTKEVKFVGIARAQGVASLRVERITIDLDFRFGERSASTSSYVVRNLEATPWEGPISFIASAGDVSIQVGGQPVALTRDTPLVPSHEKEAELKVLGRHTGNSPTPGSFDVWNFHALVPASGTFEFTVRFRVQPGVTTRRDDNSGGLLRWWAPQMESHTDFFKYPLWPAVGFGGGVGPMKIRVHCDEGTRPQDSDRVGFRLVNGAWEATVPESRTLDGLGLLDVYVGRDPSPRPRFGVTLFPAFRIDRSPDRAAFNLRSTVDLTTYRHGAVMAGMETDFYKTANATLSYQYGSASMEGSGYVTAGFILAARPQVSPGIEVGGGMRLLVVPLDIALQLHPLKLYDTREVAVFRVLLGLKVGFFAL